jgi:hypothetical protein
MLLNLADSFRGDVGGKHHRFLAFLLSRCWRIVNGWMRQRKPSANSGSKKMPDAMV